MSSRRVFRGAFWILIGILVVVHIAGGWIYSSSIIDDAFTPDPEPIVVPEGDYAMNEVTYESPLGVMDAWHLPAPGPLWVIHVHSLNATPAEPEVLFSALQAAGYPQLSITYRNDEGQPADPTGYFRYGSTEWEDLAGGVDFAEANGAEEVVLMGHGAGASHVLSYVFLNNLDVIAGVITDSANIDLGSTLDYQRTQEELPLIPVAPPVTMTWIAKFFTSLRIDVNWGTLDYIDRAERSLRVPVLAIHGTADEVIPIEQSVALAEAQPDLVDLYRVEGAGHLQSFDVDFDGYVSRMLQFLDDVD
jgi:fermentation-respiration switch protein FrsA (DUF1100 family)